MQLQTEINNDPVIFCPAETITVLVISFLNIRFLEKIENLEGGPEKGD